MSIFGRLYIIVVESIGMVLFIELSLYGSEPLNRNTNSAMPSLTSWRVFGAMICSQRKELRWLFMSVVATSCYFM